MIRRTSSAFFIAALFVLVGGAASLVAAPIRLPRQPDYHAGKITFSYLGDIWVANEDGSNVQRLTDNRAREVYPRFSPDGRWIAFTEYGGAGIGVRPFPGPGARIQISTGPAAQPRWSRDGAQLFYITSDKRLMAVSFDTHTGRPGPPRELFRTRIVRASLIAWQYDVASDGQFLINSLPAGSPPLTLLAGFDAVLRSREFRQRI